MTSSRPCLSSAEIAKEFGGLLLVNKPSGLSSQGVLTRLARQFSLKKIGHAGTLDPLADGLLICAVGEATKFLRYAVSGLKTYCVIAKLGLNSDTEDRLGHQVICASADEIAKITPLCLSKVLQSFVGPQMQRPPRYSALKHQGKCRYFYARRGEEIPEPPLRAIQIETISDLNVQSDGTFSFAVQCSPGTYIRSLVRDIGQALGCGALLMQLTRSASAPFTLWSAKRLEELLTFSPEKFFSQAIQPIETFCQTLAPVTISEEESLDLSLGRSIAFPKASVHSVEEGANLAQQVAVFEADSGLFCGVALREGASNRLLPKRWVADFHERKKRLSIF